ncbi:uncharacterized protein BDR25DRAFT_337569 [Lindgomyces ingoldianus]|uniref:Uncharacterized protein n=1 Tax=Lindgomyces ingoldianus TaxID=673940 RepID=A0ACB6QD04_9PLEO|nr:uncharacterized protein BDR25DRAFT_337569 [Lindgomyces ingoldianus]KAF2464031.1 hypothetical protein BDR25DRAFT_337569 [Lindgomyces ingoldianus]
MCSTKQSEEFNTASRSVRPGLIASGISSTVAYTYGVAGLFWYAAGATVQILMFSILACKVKQNAPRCHTFLEIIYAGYGRFAHRVFMLFAFLTNILVGSQLLLGGSTVVTSFAEMNIYAAIFLILTCVCAYVILGGLHATFLCDYSHTLILMIIMLYFMFNAYATNDLIGFPGSMYDLLEKATTQRPIAGNEDGSYLTLKSNFGLVFGVIQLCSGSGTVFLDQAYWQRAVASRPTTAVKAYILGAAYATSTLLGQGGAVALLIVLLMAVTSCASAELIAVSSLLTFDVYKAYIQPKATAKQLIFVSHVMICVFGVTMVVFACIWNAASINLGWLFLVMGLLIGGAVFPTAFAINWRGQTCIGALSGCLTVLAAGLIAWLTTAKHYYGEVTKTTNIPAKPDHDHLQTVQAEEKALRIEIGATDDRKSLRGAFILACWVSFILTFIMDFLTSMLMFFSHYIFSKGFFTGCVVVSFIWVFCSGFISTVLPIWETREFFVELWRKIPADLNGQGKERGSL